MEIRNDDEEPIWRAQIKDVKEQMSNRYLFPEQKDAKGLSERWSKYMEELVQKLEEVDHQVFLTQKTLQNQLTVGGWC